MLRVYQTDSETLERELKEWKKLVGGLDNETLRVLYDGRLSAEGDGDEDEGDVGDGEGSGAGGGSGVGGGGGSGSGSGSGSGEGSGSGSGDGDGDGEGDGGTGKGKRTTNLNQQGRKSGSVDPKKFQLRTINDVPKQVTDAQKAMHDAAMKAKLAQLQMSLKDMNSFNKYRTNVAREVRQLRVILAATEAKKKERVWIKNQVSGDIDDTKL
jgi:von Willebrand factor A domain-containing protein 8